MGQIQYLRGSIFDAGTQVIVNTVNCQGVMGKGLALAFKQRYPEMFPVYQQECREKKLRIGRPTLYQRSRPWILNFPTKDSWRANSKLEYIEKGLQYFASHYKRAGITSIAFPKLGAQNGKLSWDEVGPLMAQYLGPLDITVSIYVAEGDMEYQPDTHVDALHEKIWVRLNELAQAQSSLQQELQLNARDAKKIVARRALQELTSFKDIEEIEGLAQTSLKKIKTYIQDQQYNKAELAGMPHSAIDPKPKKSHAPTRRKQRPQMTSVGSKEPLFVLENVR